MTTIERLRALLAEATPGPWKFVEPHSVMAPLPARFGYATIPVAAIEGLFSMRHRNGALIVEGINALPALLDVIEAAQDFRGYVDFGRLRKGGREANARYNAALARLEDAS